MLDFVVFCTFWGLVRSRKCIFRERVWPILKNDNLAIYPINRLPERSERVGLEKLVWTNPFRAQMECGTA